MTPAVRATLLKKFRPSPPESTPDSRSPHTDVAIGPSGGASLLSSTRSAGMTASAEDAALTSPPTAVRRKARPPPSPGSRASADGLQARAGAAAPGGSGAASRARRRLPGHIPEARVTASAPRGKAPARAAGPKPRRASQLCGSARACGGGREGAVPGAGVGESARRDRGTPDRASFPDASIVFGKAGDFARSVLKLSLGVCTSCHRVLPCRVAGILE
ncbi:uncharacterized protein LOC113911539 [Zalophus californianus]|uniref:Uncharacterized protein LOC113911539 n=1 Tax=Zalophus californianus TaxID=9704 RepID=A0A6J2BIM9_ZALCA|nr:uncharacterized protein LOC113911539 [Zalophus californianus]